MFHPYHSYHAGEESYFKSNYNRPYETSNSSIRNLELEDKKSATVKHLNGQVGQYPPTQHRHGVADLTSEGKKLLYEGVDDYRNNNSHLPQDHYRKLFIRHVAKIVKKHSTDYDGDENTRKNTPEKATIKAEKLFGRNRTRTV